MMLYTSVFLVFGAMVTALAVVPRHGSGTVSTDRIQATDAIPPSVAAASEQAPRARDPAPVSPDSGAAVVQEPSDPDRHAKAARKSRGTLIFVLDDAGHNTWQLEPFLRLPGPVTVAVLPGLPHSAEAATMVRAAGKELILHQPMEAIDGLDPGPGAIRADMDEATIRSIVRGNLSKLPGAVGMNNHMGSKATSDVRVMTAVLDEARRAGIYFLDSLTIGDSVVHSVASLMRQTIWERSVFLDNTPDKASILHFIAEGTKVAEKRGYAIMIGHVWSSELAQTLTELYPQLVEQGFSLSTISKVMMDKDEDDGLGD
jgi:polysaccharide deacetylase 2 family uncharacterized protein YibQ